MRAAGRRGSDEALVSLQVGVGVAVERQRRGPIVNPREEDHNCPHSHDGCHHIKAEAVDGPGNAAPVILLLGKGGS